MAWTRGALPGDPVYSGIGTTSYAAGSRRKAERMINFLLQRPLAKSVASQPNLRELAAQGDRPCAWA